MVAGVAWHARQNDSASTGRWSTPYSNAPISRYRIQRHVRDWHTAVRHVTCDTAHCQLRMMIRCQCYGQSCLVPAPLQGDATGCVGCTIHEVSYQAYSRLSCSYPLQPYTFTQHTLRIPSRLQYQCIRESRAHIMSLYEQRQH